MGAYVKLLEYDNIDGMILLSELSRRRIRSIQKLIRVGRNEVVVVLRVDKEKGTVICPTCDVERADRVRLHRPLQTKSLPRRHSEMRRALQQRQDGRLDHAARGRENQNPNGDTIPRNRVAAEQKIRARGGRIQIINHVCLSPILI